MYYENIEREKAQARRPFEARNTRLGSLWRREPDQIRPFHTRFIHVDSYTAKRTPTPFAYDFIERETARDWPKTGASSGVSDRVSSRFSLHGMSRAAAFSTALE